MSPTSIFFALLIAIAGTAHAQQTSAEASAVAAEVLRNAPWVADALACPASSMPKSEILLGISKNKCKTGKRGVCLKKCAAGNASACYWLAYELQEDHANKQAVETLYQRSCTLGIMSGCTNRAAGLVSQRPNDSAADMCAAKTFSIACASEDPWACTMYANFLIKDKSVPGHEDMALAALAKSCKFGPDDPACSYAMDLKAKILKARSGVNRK